MAKQLKIIKTIHYCEYCDYCHWGIDAQYNVGWFCKHPADGWRLILVKENYDASFSKHVYIPDWCTLAESVVVNAP